MKKLLIILICILLVGCTNKSMTLYNYQEVDKILDNRANGKYKEAVVYDLRDGQDCINGHIKGFTCIFYQTNFTLDDVFNNINMVYSKNALILLICDDGEISKTLANKLKEKGYKRVYYFNGGYQEYLQQNVNFIPEIGCDC